MKWYPFDPAKGYRQKRPPMYRQVLVLLPARENLPPAVAVGYRKNGAGCKDSPYFVISGIGGVPTHWCDCLGDEFETPEIFHRGFTWKMDQHHPAKVS